MNEFVTEYENCGFFGLQATLKCIHSQTFWEKGISSFYDIHQYDKGIRNMIAAPNLYPSKEYIEILNVADFSGYSIDTKIAMNINERHLSVGMGSTVAWQNQRVDYHTFFWKYFNYGKGDFDFYQKNKNHWKLKRKLQSLSHIFIRYILDYPIKSFKVGSPHIAIPYLWMSAVVRYAGWGYSILKSAVK